MPKAYNLRLISINSDDISQNFVYNSRYDKTKDNLDFFFFGDEIKWKNRPEISCAKVNFTRSALMGWPNRVQFVPSFGKEREDDVFVERTSKLANEYTSVCPFLPIS